MKNKEIQEQRIKGYFLQATKELLKSEGLRSVNVRTVADRAGYSHTTMYNYFKDVYDLIFLCVNDFYTECQQHTGEHAKKQEKGIKRLKAAIRAYADYFIQYPGVFELFFIENLGSFKDKKNIANLVTYSLDSICQQEWDYCVSKGLLKVEQVETVKSQIRYATLGLLLLYLNRRATFSYTEFVNQLNMQINVMLEAGLSTTVVDNRSIVQSGDTAVHNSLISIKIGNLK